MNTTIAKRPLKQLHCSLEVLIQKIDNGDDCTDEDLDLLAYFIGKVQRLLPTAS